MTLKIFHRKVSCLAKQTRFVSKHSTLLMCVALSVVDINQRKLISSFPLLPVSISLVHMSQGLSIVDPFGISSTQVQPTQYGPTFLFFFQGRLDDGHLSNRGVG